MKKSLALLFAVCVFVVIAVFMTSCDALKSRIPNNNDSAENDFNEGNSNLDDESNNDSTGDGDEGNAFSQITEEQWNNSKDSAIFDNVRVDFVAKFISENNGDSEDLVEEDYFEIDGDLVRASGEITSDKNLVASVKSVYAGTVTSVIENYNLFTFDSETGKYVSSGPIVYTVTVSGIEAKITAEDIVVEFDKDIHVASLTCRMTQEFVDGGRDVKYVIDTTFIYSNYGMVDLKAEQ